MSGGAPPVELRWPPAVSDFEAPGLTAGSYPIEVGLVVWRAPDARPAGWSTLIRPAPAWEANGEWFGLLDRVDHGVRRPPTPATGAPDLDCSENGFELLVALRRDAGRWVFHDDTTGRCLFRADAEIAAMRKGGRE